MRLFLVAALVLFVLALIAAASSSLTALGVSWPVWVCGAFVAWVADLLLGDHVTLRQVHDLVHWLDDARHALAYAWAYFTWAGNVPPSLMAAGLVILHREVRVERRDRERHESLRREIHDAVRTAVSPVDDAERDIADDTKEVTR